MSDYDRLAELQMNERIDRAGRTRAARRRRDSGRHQLARGLRGLAERLDA